MCAWRNIPSSRLESLIDSMPQRVQAVIAAPQGGATRYYFVYIYVFSSLSCRSYNLCAVLYRAFCIVSMILVQTYTYPCALVSAWQCTVYSGLRVSLANALKQIWTR